MCENLLSLSIIRTLLTAAAAGSLWPSAAWAEDRALVRCLIDYGGERRSVALDERIDPLSAPAQPVGSYFLWRAVLQRQGDALELRVDTAADRDGQSPLPLHQGRFKIGRAHV